MNRKDTEQTPRLGLPPKQGLYDPQFEHDSCGVGFVVNIKGKKSHKIIRDALTILINLNHRGACGCEANTGDGAGILMQMPHGFFKEVCRKDKIKLPPLGDYGVAMVFLPRDANERRTCEKMFENIVVEEGQKFLGWRVVPTDNATLGATARAERAVRAAGFHPPQSEAGRRHGLRAQALRHPQTRRAGHPLQRGHRAAIGFTFPAFPAARSSIRECS